MARQRRVPQRTCVGCQAVEGKRQMVRVVRSPDGEVAVDPTGKRSGRGAYVHPDMRCVEAALKGRLARALKAEIGPEAVARLRAELEHAVARADLLEKLAAQRAAGGPLVPPPGGARQARGGRREER